MNLADLLRALDGANVRLSRTADSLRLRGRVGNLPPEVIASASGHKPELLDLLNGEEVTPRTLLARLAARPGYRLISDQASLLTVQEAVAASACVAIDTETTGLRVSKDRVRLLQLATEHGVYVIDCFRVDPAPLWPALHGKKLVMHNAAFDAAMLTRLGLETAASSLVDTMLLSAVLTAGDFSRSNRLQAVAERYLGSTLEKIHQKADWSGELSEDQLQYAARDVVATRDVYGPLLRDIDAVGLHNVADLEHRALPAVLWLGGNGILFDREAWLKLAEAAVAEAQQFERRLGKLAPPKPDGGAWNWNSPQQVTHAFGLLGITLESTGEEALARLDHPLAARLRRYRAAAKKAAAYGHTWLDCIGEDGRIRCAWKQTGAKTGRMASGQPNLQNLPRDPAYRRCFIAPLGRVLIKCDYSQIELRIAAKVAHETRMIDAYKRGQDLHELTARQLTGQDVVTAEQRQLAKPVNFGIIYGLGATSLARKARAEYGVELSDEQATRYRAAFLATWPGIARWHQELKRARWRQMMRTEPPETRTLTGRRVLVKPDLWHGARANYIVQGTGGDGIKAALALLWERRAEFPGAVPVLAIHDEIVVEADEDQADAAAEWLKKAMLDGMAPLIDPVPVEVDVKIARTWCGY